MGPELIGGDTAALQQYKQPPRSRAGAAEEAQLSIMGWIRVGPAAAKHAVGPTFLFVTNGQQIF